MAFTGSVATGSRVMAKCAESVRGLSLELGGKSAALLFDDAKFDNALEWYRAVTQGVWIRAEPKR